MKTVKWILVSMALVVVLSLIAACDSGIEPTAIQGSSNSVSTDDKDETINPAALTSSDLTSLARSLTSVSTLSESSGQTGILVTGQGSITLEPDLAILTLGVEARAKSVEMARAKAAVAMSGVIDALTNQGIAERDIQTRSFNIYPEYTYQEVFEDSRRYNKQVLTGYQVSNSAIIKVRNLDILAIALDDVVAEGGDATRINSIQFAIEDDSIAKIQAREKAVLHALAKADQFASLTGVSRGLLLSIREVGDSSPMVYDYGVRSGALAEAYDAPTSINTGELEVQISVQATFAIDLQ